MVVTLSATWFTVSAIIYDINLVSRLWTGVSDFGDFYLFHVFHGVCVLGSKYLVLYKLLEKNCPYLGFGLT